MHKMSKNVLIISSSPRKGGNSNILCDAFAEGAKAAGNDGATRAHMGDAEQGCA